MLVDETTVVETTEEHLRRVHGSEHGGEEEEGLEPEEAKGKGLLQSNVTLYESAVQVIR